MPGFDDIISASINVNANVAGAANVNTLEQAMRQLNATLVQTNSALQQGGNQFVKHGQSLMNLDSQIKSVVTRYLSLYAAIRLVTDAFKAASSFDEQLDKLAVSSGKTGAAFEQASQNLHRFVLGLSEGTIFSEDKVLGGLTKFRDAGFDVFSMTKEQLAPVLQAATATMQDLGDVADATAVTLRQFNLGLNDTGHVANLMYEAFKLAGTGAEGFQQQITAAGASAAAAGVSLESYLAVTTRLKQLGFSDSQSAQFQKLFFAAAEAPSAKQLQSIRDSGVNPYRSPESFNADIDRESTGLTGLMNLGRRALGKSSGLDAAQQSKAQASAFQEVQTKLVSLADSQDKVNVGLFVYGEYVDSTKSRIDDLKNTQSAWKDKLAETNDTITKVTAQMEEAKSHFDQLANAEVTGMSAFDTAIEKAELASQRQELANLNLTRSFGDMDDAIKKTSGTAKDLEKQLGDLRSEELKGERAYSDTSFRIGQQIKALELQKNNLAPQAMFERNQLDKQIALLNRQKTQVDLRDSIDFDPQKRAIQQAGDAADIARGAKPSAGSSADIIGQIGSIGSALASTKKGEDALKSLQEQVDRLKLEKAVQFGDQLFQIKERARELREQLGLVAREQSFDKIMGGLGDEASKYAGLKATLGELKTARDIEKRQVDSYDGQVRVLSRTLKDYEGHVSDLKSQEQQLKDETKKYEDVAAGMTKPLKDQAVFIDELKNSAMGAGAAYDFLGKRAGAMMVALLGDKGQNISILETLRDELKNTVKDGQEMARMALQVDADIYGIQARAAARAKNFQIEVGTAGAAGLINGAQAAYNDVTHPVDSFKSFADSLGTISDLRNYSWFPGHYASGGIVSGYGHGDVVPAWLTPGEYVASKDDPHHPANGGAGVVINFQGPVNMRSDNDVRQLASMISEKLHQEHRRVASGMPA